MSSLGQSHSNTWFQFWLQFLHTC